MWTIFELNWNSYPPILTFLHLSSCIITFPCHQPFLSLSWWNLLSLSMWLVPFLIAFGLWLKMLSLIWRCWGPLIKWRIIGRGHQRPTYHFRSPHCEHHHLLLWHNHNCYCLLLNNFLWNPRFLLNCAFFKTSNLLFFFPLLILASSTFHFCSVSLQLLDIFFCLPPYPPSTNLSLFFSTYFGWTSFNKLCQFVHQNT